MSDLYEFETLKSLDKYQTANHIKSELYQNEDSAYITKNSQGEQLLSNYRRGIFGRKEDSDKMQAVKRELRNLNGLYTSPMMIEKDGFEAQLDLGTVIYKDLLTACDEYLSIRKKAADKKKTSEAYQRYHLVELTRKNAANEYRLFKTRAWTVFNDAKKIKGIEDRPLWISVLREIRTLKLNLDQDGVNVETTGGNTSSVLKVTVNEEVGFIKEDEKVTEPKKALERYINKQEGEHKKFLDYFKEIFCDDYDKDKFYNTMRSGMASKYNEAASKMKVTAQLIKSELGRVAFVQVLRAMYEDKLKKDNMLDSLTSEKNINILLDLAETFLKARLAYRMTKNNIGIDSPYLTKRNVAVYKISELLGISDIIPMSKNIEYTYKNDVHTGIILEKAEGITLYEARKLHQVQFSAKALLQLNSLEILDHIVGQIDHHSKNIIVDYDEETNTVKSIKGIDNDMCLGTNQLENLLDGDLLGTSKMLKGLMGKNRGIYISCVNKNLYDSLQILPRKMIEMAVKDILSESEINALWDRIKYVKNCLKNAKDYKLKDVGLRADSPRLNGKILVTEDDLANEDSCMRIKESIYNQQYGYRNMLSSDSRL